MKRPNRLFFFTIIGFLFFHNPLGLKAEEELLQVPAALHISSSSSDGKQSLNQIADVARQSGIKVIVMGENFNVKVTYGIWPLRNLIKKTQTGYCLLRHGLKRYWKDIQEAQAKNPDILLIPGVEATPFYYWTGSPFKKNLKLNQLHEHILITGFKDIKDYIHLPVISNRHSSTQRFSLWLLWPLVTLIAGYLCFKRAKRERDLIMSPLGPYARLMEIFGILMIVASILFLLNNFPFKKSKYDPYTFKGGIGPFQDLFDYVKQRDGMTFFAHPEIGNETHRGGIKIETKSYENDLLRSKNYTGYAILYEGYKKVGLPGGIWDTTLQQYCAGERASPVWAIGELDYEGSGSLSKRMKDLRVILLMQEFTQQEVFKALKTGKMYMVRGIGEFDFVLNTFAVKDSLSDAQGIISDEIDIKGPALVNINGHITYDHNNQPKHLPDKVMIQLIRNGAIIKTFETDTPWDIQYQDDYWVPGEKIYYRLLIISPKKMLITNPIFVRFKF